jgi:hypothetical protein
VTLADLLPSIQSLSQAEKLQLMQFLSAEVAQTSESNDRVPTVAIWSPYDAHEGAATLLQVLKDAKDGER